jgi:hypothetical protein
MPSIVKEHPGVSIFSLSYLVAMTLIGGSLPSSTDLRLALFFGTVGIFMVIVAVSYPKVRFSTAVLVGLSVWGLAHMAGGLLEVDRRPLYNYQLIEHVLRFDQLVHAFGFGFATAATWEALRTWLPPHPRLTFGLGVIVALAGMGLGAINEVLEFIATRIDPNSNVGGYENTGWDLIFNLFGCVAAAAIVMTIERRKRRLTDQA